MLMRRWTPPSQVPTTSLDVAGGGSGHHPKQRTFLRWAKVFIYLIIAITLIVFCTIYTIQKENFFNEEYNRQQRNEQNREDRLVFKEFLDEISKLMVTNSIDLIQAKTLMIIPKLNKQQKQDLLFFLYSQKLLQNSTDFNLQNMNFNDIELFCSNHFQQIHLIGVQLKNAIFRNCHFKSANFQQSNLFNSRFINSTIENSSFIRANLDQSQFIRTDIRHVDFTEASLSQSNFLQANIVQGNRFLNADLYQANLTEHQINGKYGLSTIEHDFTNARFPNGSFHVDESERNLIINGEDCANLNRPIWKVTDQTMNLSFINSSTNECALVLSAKTRVYQKISFDTYSLLLNTKQVALLFHLKSNCNESFVDINMYDFNNILHESETFSHVIADTDNNTNSTIYEFLHSTSTPVPKHTQYLQIYLINQEDTICYFTNMSLTIKFD